MNLLALSEGEILREFWVTRPELPRVDITVPPGTWVTLGFLCKYLVLGKFSVCYPKNFLPVYQGGSREETQEVWLDTYAQVASLDEEPVLLMRLP